MASGRFVAYYRVSTARQGASGLGLEGQREAVRSYLNGGDWKLLGEHTDIESGKRVENRPELQKAMQLAKRTGATLVIAKLDRLSRDAHFLMGLEKAGVEFVAVDMPDANRLTIGIMALVAQQEREAISARTKAALAAAKARGTTLGGWRGGPKPDGAAARAGSVAKADAFAKDLIGEVRELLAGGASLRAVAATFTARGYETARGGAWTATAVKNLLARAA